LKPRTLRRRRGHHQVPFAFEEGRHNPLVLKIHYAPAMSFEEIAAKLGTSKQSVWNTYAVALEKIRRQLRKHPHLYTALLNHDEGAGGDVFPDHDLD